MLAIAIYRAAGRRAVDRRRGGGYGVNIRMRACRPGMGGGRRRRGKIIIVTMMMHHLRGVARRLACTWRRRHRPSGIDYFGRLYIAIGISHLAWHGMAAQSGSMVSPLCRGAGEGGHPVGIGSSISAAHLARRGGRHRAAAIISAAKHAPPTSCARSSWRAAARRCNEAEGAMRPRGDLK